MYVLLFNQKFYQSYLLYFQLKYWTLGNLKDQGVIIDSKLNCSIHTEMIKYKTIRNLGFIKRTYWLFRDSISLKILFWALVRYNLDIIHSFGLIIHQSKLKRSNQFIITFYNLSPLTLIFIGLLIVLTIQC